MRLTINEGKADGIKVSECMLFDSNSLLALVGTSLFPKKQLLRIRLNEWPTPAFLLKNEAEEEDDIEDKAVLSVPILDERARFKRVASVRLPILFIESVVVSSILAVVCLRFRKFSSGPSPETKLVELFRIA